VIQNGSAKSGFLRPVLCFARNVKLQAPRIRTVVVQPHLNFYFRHIAVLKIETVFGRDRVIRVFTVSADVRHGVLQERIAGSLNLSTSVVPVNGSISIYQFLSRALTLTAYWSIVEFLQDAFWPLHLGQPWRSNGVGVDGGLCFSSWPLVIKRSRHVTYPRGKAFHFAVA
jgi:hypothetical protein